MIEKETIFLTLQQAREAVCIDFCRYAPQIMLFSEVLRIISNGKAVINKEREKEGRWISAEPGSKMIWMNGPALGEYVCRALLEKDLEAEDIVSVCARVFQARAFKGRDPESDLAGVFIETGMETFSCRQCGDCCNFLDYHDALTQADVERWKQLGRQDILDWVSVSRTPNGKSGYRIWVEPKTGKMIDRCPFLKPLSTENHWLCRIHDVKPCICREYPVSRKHGLMTGCPGFLR